MKFTKKKLEKELNSKKIRMIRNCKSCAYFMTQFYEGQVMNTGRCLHIAFFTTGFIKQDMETGRIIEQARSNCRERPTQEEIQKFFDSGFVWGDFKDLQMYNRCCTHWRSHLSFSHLFLDEGVPREYVGAFSSTKNLVLKKYEKYKSFNSCEYFSHEVEDKFLFYQPCVLCRNFFYKVKKGMPIPFEGFCGLDKVEGSNLYSLDGILKPCKSYFSCKYWSLHPSIKVRESFSQTPIPPRLYTYIETSPMCLTLDDFARCYRNPNISRESYFTEKELQAVTGQNFVKTLHAFYASLNRAKFEKNEGMPDILAYFLKRLKRGSNQAKLKFDPLKKYEDSFIKLDKKKLECLDKDLNTGNLYINKEA